VPDCSEKAGAPSAVNRINTQYCRLRLVSIAGPYAVTATRALVKR
jgi:hypothetical protein